MRTYGLLVMLLCAGCEGQPDPLKGHPLKSLVHFEAIHYAAGKEHPRQLIIRGKLDGPGKLDLNPNHLMLGTDGKIQGSTCLGWAPVPVQIKSVETPDPDKKGRKVYDIIPEKGELERKFSLILSESDAGPHHLLIREGEKVVGTYPLVDPDREGHQAQAAQLAKASPEEQKAIVELRKLVGYSFRFRMESKDAVTFLYFPYGAEEIGKLDPALQGLKTSHT